MAVAELDRDQGLRAIFAPRSVAVVGASDKDGKMGTTFMRNLSGFAGSVVPITTSQRSVFGTPALASLRDAPGEIDLAVIVIPAAAVPGVLADAAHARVRAAVVISGGFAEIGPSGEALQDEALEAARAGNVRVVGPNCFGLLNCHLGLNASMAAGTPSRAGGVSLVTQSGAYGMSIYSFGEEEQLGFSKVLAAGNKVDVEETEVLKYLAGDPETSVMCFFLESLAEGRRFCELVRDGAPSKPVIVTKTGRSTAGARAAMSHTAALAGSGALWREALEQCNAIVATSGLEMMDVAKALDWQPTPRGTRVAIVTNSGGTGVELTDLLSDEELSVPELSGPLQDRLQCVLPPHGSPRNPVDVTPDWRRFPELYAHSVNELVRSGEVDIVMPILLQRSAADRGVMTALLKTVSALRDDGLEVPVYVCWVAPGSAEPNREHLQQGKIPCFEWPYRAARAAGHCARYGNRRTLIGSRGVRSARRAGSSSIEGLGEGLAPPEVASRLITEAGIPVVAEERCGSVEEAVSAATRIGFPVVVKLLSDTITHKSDVGGVATNLSDREQVIEAGRKVLGIEGATGLLVQQQLEGTEVIVGGYRDPQFGPAVVAGLGGVFVEVLNAVSFRLAPLEHEEAIEAIRGANGFELLEGARGQPPADIDALAAIVVSVGDLIADPAVSEIDLNPVMGMRDRAVAVDYRIVGGPNSPPDK